MDAKWIVFCDNPNEQGLAYGPFETRDEAEALVVAIGEETECPNEHLVIELRAAWGD